MLIDELVPPSKGSLRGRNLVLAPLVDRNCDPQCTGQALEAGFGDVVAVRAIERVDMQGDASIYCEGLKELAHELCVEIADFRGRKVRLEDEERPARDIEHDARQRLVHGQMHVAIATDPFALAESLLH